MMDIMIGRCMIIFIIETSSTRKMAVVAVAGRRGQFFSIDGYSMSKRMRPTPKAKGRAIEGGGFASWLMASSALS
jgi:hypothetical protein